MSRSTQSSSLLSNPLHHVWTWTEILERDLNHWLQWLTVRHATQLVLCITINDMDTIINDDIWLSMPRSWFAVYPSRKSPWMYWLPKIDLDKTSADTMIPWERYQSHIQNQLKELERTITIDTEQSLKLATYIARWYKEPSQELISTIAWVIQQQTPLRQDPVLFLSRRNQYDQNEFTVSWKLVLPYTMDFWDLPAPILMAIWEYASRNEVYTKLVPKVSTWYDTGKLLTDSLQLKPWSRWVLETTMIQDHM